MQESQVNNFKQSAFWIIATLFYLSGCSYSPVNQVPQNSVEAGAQHLNAIVEPTRPHKAIRKCMVTGWELEGGTTQNGNTFSGKSGIKCEGHVVRDMGVNRHEDGAGLSLDEKRELLRREAEWNRLGGGG